MNPAQPRSLLKRLALAVLLGSVSLGAHVQAADRTSFYSSANDGRVVQLGIGKSYVVDLPADASEVLVADPKIANAVVRSARKAYVIGVAIGETDIIFFDKDGLQIENLAVSVARDLSPIRNNIRASMPDASVVASSVGESVMLTGSVRSPADAQAAADIAANLVGDPNKVVNALSIEGRDQVMLKVRIVEMQRNIAKQFGIKLDGAGINGGTIVAGGSNPASPFGTAPGSVLGEVLDSPVGTVDQNVLGNGLGIAHRWGSGFFLANIEAMESKNLLRTLAEPNLTAISGEKAEFLAGGEFPIPVAAENDRITVEFKKYGVGLTFTPVVLSSGRISMQIGTEVSELSDENAVALGSDEARILIRGLTVRRASTTIELPSGGSFAMAGLLQDNSRQAMQGLPGLIKVPVLGALFRSRAYQRGQTELVVIVTPYLVKSNGIEKLASPDDGFSTPSDAETLLLGRLNKIYAPGLNAKPGAYRGPIGHIVE